MPRVTHSELCSWGTIMAKAAGLLSGLAMHHRSCDALYRAILKMESELMNHCTEISNAIPSKETHDSDQP